MQKNDGKIKKNKSFYILALFCAACLIVVVIGIIVLKTKVFDEKNNPNTDMTNEQDEIPVTDKYLSNLGYDVITLTYEDLIEIAQKYTQTGEYDISVEAYQIAIQNDPEKEKAYDYLIQLYEDMLNKAIEESQNDKITELIESIISICEMAFNNTGQTKYREKLEYYSNEKEVFIQQKDSKIALKKKAIVNYNSIKTEYSYEYDNENKLIKAPSFNINRGFQGWEYYYYSDDGSLLKTVSESEEDFDYGSVTENIYDGKGNIIKSTFHNANNYETYVTEYEYTYDENDRILSCSMYSDGALLTVYDYSYDEDGNVIINGQTKSDKQGSSSTTETKGKYIYSTFYNGNEVFCTVEGERDYMGNTTKTTTFGPNGEEQVSIEYIYEYIE